MDRHALAVRGYWIAGSILSPFVERLSRPVFIIGSGRCGSRLLARILSSHRQIDVYPNEANYLWHPALYPRQSGTENVAPIEVDPVQYTESSLASWPEGHAKRIRRTFLGYQRTRGRSDVFCVKSAMISHMLPTLVELYNDARFIHLYRFGPKVVDSYVVKNAGDYSAFAPTEAAYRTLCAQYWNACILDIDAQVETLGLGEDRYLEFSYETLCENTAVVMGKMAQYLGVNADGYAYDVAEIAPLGYDVPIARTVLQGMDIGEELSEGMERKGYVR